MSKDMSKKEFLKTTTKEKLYDLWGAVYNEKKKLQHELRILKDQLQHEIKERDKFERFYNKARDLA